ncbi:MAG TPA: hypothetical protein VF936_05305, partial [Burkholderiales bacterium]
MKIEPEALGGPIGASALRRLLALRGQRLELAEVRHALEQAGEPRFAGGREALAALSAALGSLGATRVRLAATRADMLSERHLPALVEHEGRTWVLRELRGTRRVLDAGDGKPREVDEEVSLAVFRALSGVRLDARPGTVGTLAAQVAGLEVARSFFASSVLFTLAEVPFALLFAGIIAFIAGPIAWVYVPLALGALAAALVAAA